AASALTTSGRFTRHSSSSSAFSRAWPCAVISAVLFSAGGRQRPMRGSAPAENAAEEAADDLVADLPAVFLAELAGHGFADRAADAAADRAADGARGLFGHAFDHALAAPGAEQELADLVAEAAFLRLGGGGRGLAGLLHARGQQFRRRFAVDRGVVLAADRAAGAHLHALGPGDRAHPA